MKQLEQGPRTAELLAMTPEEQEQQLRVVEDSYYFCRIVRVAALGMRWGSWRVAVMGGLYAAVTKDYPQAISMVTLAGAANVGGRMLSHYSELELPEVSYELAILQGVNGSKPVELVGDVTGEVPQPAVLAVVDL